MSRQLLSNPLRRRKGRGSASRTVRLHVEPLEERCVPTMIVGLPTTDLNGVKYYSAVSDYQGNQPVILRTLAPTNPAPGMPHRFLYLLPVEPGLTTQNSQFGDGLEEARTLDLQDKYNCTLVAPSFNINPWYADNPNDTSRRLESFMVKDFVPWVDQMAAPGENPVRWLVGFSKSGFGGLGLIFRHPDVFSAIAAWDAPAQLSDVNTYSGTLPVLYTGMADNYGTQANFDTYRIPPLVANQNAPFTARNRIWISGDGVYFTPDMQTLDQQMTAAGVLHTFVGGAPTRAHNWSSGWLPGAVQSLASATQFSVSAPASATAGTAFSIAVTALDGSNETVAGYRGTVHFTSTDTRAGVVLPADYTFTATDNGVHTFTNGATLVTAGSRTITATDTGTASITGSQTGITVNPAAASTLVVAGFPSPITAGVAGAVAVTAKDPYGNTATSYAGTVHLTSSDAQAVLPVNSTLTNGTGSFSVTLKTAGQQSLTATDTVTASIAGSQTGISVNAAAASSLIVSGFPATTTAGTAGNFAVTAKDPYGNTATGYTGTVRFTSSDSQAALPANSTLTNGAGSFTATLKTAGAQSLTATDTVTATITGSQTGITVNPAAASTLVVAGFPSPVTAGTAATVTVTAKDAYGNTATGYTGTVRITSSDGQAVLPANSTLTNGTGPFTATLKTAGAQSLTATDTVTATITGSASVTVNPAAATHYQLAAPGSATAGSAFTITLTALDQFNNTATAYQGKAHFTASDAGAGVVLPADYTFVAGDNGVHTFTNGVTLVTAGSRTITATDTVTASITGSASVTVQQTDTSPPTAPSNLSAAESGFQINLSWTASTDNVGVSGYFVERENPGSTTFVQIGTTTGTTYTDTGAAPNSTYSYRVRAGDTSGNLSGYSNVVGVTTPAALTVVGTPTVDANGVVSYSVVSPYLGAQTQTLRVLQPTHPSPGQPPRFLYLLPVLAGLDTTTYGDGLQTAEQMDLQDQYNATLIAPSFPINPWYADSATDPTLQLESFMVKALVPWVKQTQAATGTTPPNWLVGFSKSGFGVLDLILRNPNVFNAAACWDAPVQTTDVNTFSDMLANYGTQQNFANYEIPPLVAQDNAPFQTTNRLWISGDNGAFTSQMVTLDQQMTAAGIKHTFVGGATRAHTWMSGWLPLAVQGLAPSMANVTVLDDSSSQGFTATAGWLNYVGAGYQGNMHYKQSGSGQETAQWTFTGLSAGRYRVSATWVADPNRVANAPYTVLDGSTTLGTVAINQQQQPSTLSDLGVSWQDLGGPYAISSGTLTVKLSDLATAGAYLIADAIRVEYLGAPVNGPITRVMYNQAALSDGTSQVNFGSTLPGAPLMQTFQVYNDGNANLTLGAITVPAGFSVASGFGATTLAPGASTSFSVSLNASAAGSYSGSVSFATNDSNHPSFTFTVLGTVSTTLVVDDSSSAGFTATAGWLTYTGAGYQGNMHYKQSGSGQETAQWAFTGLTAGRYRVSTTWVTDPNRVANAPYTVLFGSTTLGTAAVDQRQQPSSLTDLGVSWQDLGGPYQVTSSGTLTVKLSDLATAGAYLIADAVRVQYLGAPVNGPITRLMYNQAALSDGSSQVNFGTTLPGAPVTQTFQVYNDGNANLTLGTITVPAGFSVASGFGATTLAPGASTSFSVQLTASAAGSYSGPVSFATNDSNHPSFTFTVQGTVSTTLVVDDSSSAGFTATAGWLNYVGAGYLGEMDYKQSGSGQETATWTFSGLTPGHYRVSATWVAATNRVANAPYTVLLGSTTLGTFAVDQRQQPSSLTDLGVSWQDLGGPYAISGGMITVKLSDLATAGAYLIADAIRIQNLGNAPPVANNVSAQTVMNTNVNIPVLASCSDPDQDPLTVTAVTQGAHGSVSINANNTVTYTPNSQYTGTDSFTYTIADPCGATATATVTVTIGQAQLAEGGPSSVDGPVPLLTEAELQPVLTDAIREVTHEFNVKQPDQFFGQLDIRLIDHLQSGILGITYGHTIWIDRSAAGHGWYVGLDDGAFGAAVVGGDRFAQPGSAAFGQFDLLTVVTHELAHVVGYASVDASVLPHDLMTKTIAPGVRRISHEDVLFVSMTSTTSPTPIAADMAPAATLPVRPAATEESTFVAMPPAALLADPRTAAIDQVFRDAAAFTMPASVTLLPLLDPAFDPLPFGVSRAELLAADNSSSDGDAVLAAGHGDDIVISREGKDMLVGGTVDIHAQIGLPTWAAFAASEKMEKLIHEEI